MHLCEKASVASPLEQTQRAHYRIQSSAPYGDLALSPVPRPLALVQSFTATTVNPRQPTSWTDDG